MANELSDFQKRYKMMKPKLKPYSKKDVDYTINDLKTFSDRLKGAAAEFAQAVADAQDDGVKGGSYKDYMKDKGVQKAFKYYKLTFENIQDSQKDLGKLAGDTGKLSKEVQKLRDELDKRVGKRPAGPVKKDYDALTKEIVSDLSGLKTMSTAPKMIPRDALDAVKNFDASINDLVKLAAKLPRKPIKELPVELKEKGFQKLQTDVKLAEKMTQKHVKAIHVALKKGDGKAAQEALDDLKSAGADLLGIAQMLSKAQRTYNRALRKVDYAEEFPKLEEAAGRIARRTLAEWKRASRDVKST